MSGFEPDPPGAAVVPAADAAADDDADDAAATPWMLEVPLCPVAITTPTAAHAPSTTAAPGPSQRRGARSHVP
ncbi:MAG: hypothetical protein ACRDLV_00535, partial [Solirubrobacteraceae bacterium]